MLLTAVGSAVPSSPFGAWMVSTFYSNSHSKDLYPRNPAEKPAGADALAPGRFFLTANGRRDSHSVRLSGGERNPSPRAGRPYGAISWGEIRKLIDTPAACEKDDAPFVVLSSYVECDGRTHAVQRECGLFGGLAVDIDEGNHSLTDVLAAVRGVTGGAAAEIYSSASASHDRRKWRVLIPLLRPMKGADYDDTQKALYGLLLERGLKCDIALARTGQPIFLPNVPPQRRDENGEPLFYQSCHVDGPLLDLDDTSAIIVARYALRQKAAAEEAERLARSAAYQKRKQARIEATGDDFDPVEHFNSRHTVEEMLRRYQFVKSPSRRGNHYRSPLSKSGSFSTEDRGDHWVTVSSWAHDHNVGFVSKSGNRYGDAFSLFVHFEHGGNRAAAVRAYAEDVGRSLEAAPVVIEPLPDRGEERDLDEWRQEMHAERAMALRLPGLHLDRSQTGSGKTFATIHEIIRATRPPAEKKQAWSEDVVPIQTVLIALPDHANVREHVAAWQAEGQNAAAYPELSEENCKNYGEASRAQSLGLVAGAAVCWRCPLKTSCLYQKQMQAAKDADVRVATHERLRLSSERITAGIDAIVIDENPESVLAPAVTARVDDLAAVVTLAREVCHGLLFRDGRVLETTAEEKAFAEAIVEAHETIIRAAEATQQAGATDIEMPPVHSVPDRWQATLMRWADAVSIDVSDKNRQERFQKSMQLLTKIVTGGAERMTLIVEQTKRHEKQADGTVKEWNPLHHFVTVSWKTRLPSVPTLLLDATANADDIRARVGVDVTDRTPAGHLPARQKVVQVVVDVEKGAAASSAARLVEAFLHDHPEVQRLGLIGHSSHVREMMTDDSVLPPSLRARISKHCYFGQGPDRASNSWQDECDHLLIVGTPRPGGTPVRERLVLTGKHDAAAQTSGDWGPRHWEGVTTDGRVVTVEGKGYRDPVWHAAHSALVRSSLQQAVGRGRLISDNGIPVTVFSDEPLGVPVDDRLEPVSPVVMQAVEAVRGVLAGEPGTELFPIGNTYRKMFGSRVAVRVSAVIDLMMAHANMHGDKLGRRAAEKRLAMAKHHGRLEAPQKGWLALPVDQPTGPAPAMLAPLRPATVVSATGPTEPVVAADVAAEITHETTISLTTADIPSGPLPVGDLVAQIDERAAIMAEGDDLDDATADRLAIEAVMGRGVSEPLHPAETVGVDNLALAARLHPLVDHAVQKFGGSLRVISEADDPFSAGWRSKQTKPPPGRCGCGSDRWVDVPIHRGASVRRECGQCGRFKDFVVWCGKPAAGWVEVLPPAPDPKTARRDTPVGNRLSFLSAAPEMPMMPSPG